jgi:hypothetical protein
MSLIVRTLGVNILLSQIELQYHLRLINAARSNFSLQPWHKVAQIDGQDPENLRIPDDPTSHLAALTIIIVHPETMSEAKFELAVSIVRIDLSLE